MAVIRFTTSRITSEDVVISAGFSHLLVTYAPGTPVKINRNKVWSLAATSEEIGKRYKVKNEHRGLREREEGYKLVLVQVKACQKCHLS